MSLYTVVPDDFPALFAVSPQAERLTSLGRARIWTDRAAGPEELIARLRDAHAAINMRSFTRFTREVMAACPRLGLISICGTGTDNVDLDAATELGILVCNTPDANSRSVAEHTWALLLAAARGLHAMEDQLRRGEWWHHYGMELHGKTLGLVGLGRVAQLVAGYGRAFGMRVLAWSWTPDLERAKRCGIEQTDLETLLRESDVVSLHLRLSDRSYRLIGEPALALLKPGAILVNTARGALTDEVALARALADGRLAAAAIDCYEEEPLPIDHPLRSAPNCTLIPHAGWMTAEARERMLAQPVDHVEAWALGRPVNVVNPDALPHARRASMKDGDAEEAPARGAPQPGVG